MSELGDKLAAIRQRAIDSGELPGEDMLAADEIRPYREGWLAEWRELVVLRAERDRLAAELEATKAVSASRMDEIRKLLSAQSQIRAELSATRANAERYRWLRASNENLDEAIFVTMGDYSMEWRDGADALIDAARAALSAGSARPCTCHPGDNPPVPCPRRYALSECRLAAAEAARRALDWLHQTDHEDSAGPALSGMQVVIDPTMPEGTAELRCGESRVPIVPSAGSAPAPKCPKCGLPQAECDSERDYDARNLPLV